MRPEFLLFARLPKMSVKISSRMIQAAEAIDLLRFFLQRRSDIYYEIVKIWFFTQFFFGNIEQKYFSFD